MNYDAENRLASVTGPNSFSASFVYDGDGKRVKSTMGTETILFVGAHYEVTNPGAGQTVSKYYFAGATRIATRKYSIPSYMNVEYNLSDHLGSTSLTTDSTGAKVSEIKYKPWGEVRTATIESGVSTTPTYQLTKYTFTGQFSYMDDPATSGVTEGFGLMFYNARMYDPALGRFTSADTIIPGGVQGYDRYAYANNNPLYYTDPTGHAAIGDSNGEGGCDTPGSPRCILDRYYEAGVSTDSEWRQDMELYYYQLAYPDYNASTDPYLERSQILSVIAPRDRAGCAAGSYWSCFAMGVEGGIGTSIALPVIIQPAEPAPQNYGDYADPDCPGCGYSASGDQDTQWVFGSNHSSQQWQNKMTQRGWTPEQITEAIRYGESYPAVNQVHPGDPATRYVNPETGRSVVIDNVTHEIIHIGGDGYGY